jgi:hypothetical protein
VFFGTDQAAVTNGTAPAQTVTDHTFTMSSSGTDIWNNGDQFRFAYKQLSGDGSIVARVDSLVNTNV